MERSRFGKTELMVSKVAFGGIPIMRISKDEAVRVVREAISLGVNFIDTAHVYTDSEEKIGAAIKGMRRDDLVIATKSPAGDKKAFNEHLDLSLKRLGVDYIDIYQLHNIASKARWDEVSAPGGAMEGLDEAIRNGKIRFAGFSSHSVPVSAELMKTGRFASVQLPFNFIDAEAADEAIPLAKKLDIGFIAMKPMGGGLLDNAGLIYRYLGQYDNIIPDPGIEKIEEIREIAAIINKNEAFTGEDQKEIEKLRIQFGSSWCHRCDYCQPCPQGIGVSMALCLKSAFKRMTAERARSMVGPAIEKARTCLECGICKTRCPYHLDIPSLLKESVNCWDSL
jgi:predicted aldo/keto reductase-like oxidoreductase